MNAHQVVNDVSQIAPEIDGFWEAVAAAPSVVLLLDYDGTLAPFHAQRMQAFPADGAVDALVAISQSRSTTVVIVSGRPVQEVLTLLPRPALTIIGTHGYETRYLGSETQVRSISDSQSKILDRAFSDAVEVIGTEHVERKSATVAAHFRAMKPEYAEKSRSDILARWLEYADKEIVEVREFNGGIEMRAIGINKGTAVEEFLAGQPETTLAVYIGDDETDEDAFRAVNLHGGYTIRVGDQHHETAAFGNLASCKSVVDFLERWIGARVKP